MVFAERYRQMLQAGETPPVSFPYDERVFRPRVAGLIAVGGALTSGWRSLALPLMHQLTFSAQIAIADQLLVSGAGMPRSVVLDDEAVDGARRVGRSVGSQLGRPFEQVEYRGEPGICPLCHLSVVTVNGQEVECATCGAGGRLVVDGGAAIVRFDDPDALQRSVVTLAEKRAHFAEVQATGKLQQILDRYYFASSEFDYVSSRAFVRHLVNQQELLGLRLLTLHNLWFTLRLTAGAREAITRGAFDAYRADALASLAAGLEEER